MAPDVRRMLTLCMLGLVVLGATAQPLNYKVSCSIPTFTPAQLNTGVVDTNLILRASTPPNLPRSTCKSNCLTFNYCLGIVFKPTAPINTLNLAMQVGACSYVIKYDTAAQPLGIKTVPATGSEFSRKEVRCYTDDHQYECTPTFYSAGPKLDTTGTAFTYTTPSGTLFSVSKDGNIYQCQDACADTAGCLGFEYVLRTAVGGVPTCKLATAGGPVTALKPAPITTPPWAFNKDAPASFWFQNTNPTTGQTPVCNKFVPNPTTFNFTGCALQWKVLPQYSFINVRKAGQTTFTVPVQAGVTTDATCATTCAANPLCWGYNWNTVLPQCYILFNRMAEMQIYNQPGVGSNLVAKDLIFKRKQYHCPDPTAPTTKTCIFSSNGAYGPYQVLGNQKGTTIKSIYDCANSQILLNLGFVMSSVDNVCTEVTPTSIYKDTAPTKTGERGDLFVNQVPLPPSYLSFEREYVGKPAFWPAGVFDVKPLPTTATMCHPIVPTCKVEFEVVANVSLVKDKVGPLGTVSTQAACQTICANNNNCKAFHYGGGTKCEISSGRDQILPRLITVPDTAYNVYVRQYRCGDCWFQRVLNYQATGGTLMPQYVQSDACLTACQTSTTACQAIQWTQSLFQCRHYSTITPFAQLTAVSSTQASTEYFYLYKCNQCKPSFGSAWNGFDYSNVPAGSKTVTTEFTEADCRFKCATDRLCAGYTWNTQTYACTRSKDQLKPKYISCTLNQNCQTSQYSTYIKTVQCPSCSYTPYPGKTAPTAFSIASTAVNHDQCLVYCNQLQGCKGVMFDTSQVKCFLYKVDIVETTLVPNTNAITYILHSCPTCVPTWNTQSNKAQQGGTPTISHITYQAYDCQVLCTNTPGCVVADFSPNLAICSLYNLATPPAFNPGYTEYAVEMQCPMCAFKLYSGMVGKTPQHQAGITTKADCLYSCEQSSTCKAVSFSTGAGTVCNFYARDDTTQLVSSSGALNYYSGGTCRICVPTYTTVFGKSGSITTAGTFYNFVTQAQSICQSNCTSNLGCTGIMYSTSSQQCTIFTKQAPLQPFTASGTTYMSKSFNCDGCQYTPYPGTRPSIQTGGTVQPTLVQEMDCIGGCQKHGTCLACTFQRKPTTVCTFFSTDDSASLATSVDTTYYIASGCKDCTVNYTEIQQTFRTGSTLQPAITNIDVATCKMACTSNHQCAGVSYQPIGRRCSFYGDHAPHQLAVDTGFTYYERGRACPQGCLYKYHPGKSTSLPGTYKPANLDQYSCVSLCSADSGCKAATFDKGAQHCYWYYVNIGAAAMIDKANWVLYDSGICKNCQRSVVSYIGKNMLGGKIATPLGVTLGSAAQCSSYCLTGVSNCIASAYDGTRCFVFDIYAQVIGISGFTLTQVIQKCGDCNFLPHPGKAVKANAPGTRILMQNYQSMAACLAACATDNLCHSLEFNFTRKACTFFDNDQSANLVTAPNSWFGAGATCKLCRKGYQKYASSTFSQGTSSTASAQDAAECGKKCSATSCFGYTWKSATPTSNAVCTLYATVGLGQVITSSTQTLYRMYRDCLGCELLPVPKYAPSATGTPQTSYLTELECIRYCSEHTTCFAVSFNTKSLQCLSYATDVANTLKANPDVNYWSAAECRVCQLSYKMNSNQRATVTSPVVLASATTRAMCETACSSSSSCASYDFNKNSNQCFLNNNGLLGLSSDTYFDNYRKVRQCNGCEFVPYPGKAGKDGQVQAAFKSITQCLKGCISSTKCLGIDFSLTSSICVFFPTSQPPSQLSDATGATYWSASACKECSTQYIEMKGKHRTAGRRVENVASSNACKALCTIDSKCVYCDYRSAVKYCFIHTNTQSALQSSLNFVTYEKTLDCEGCVFSLHTDKRGPTANLQSQIVSPVSCASSCQNTTGCQAISFDMNNIKCYFSTTDDKAALTTDTNFQYWSSGACKACQTKFTTKTGIYYRSLSTSPVLRISLKACHDLCMADSTCVTFTTFQSPDLNIANNRCFMNSKHGIETKLGNEGGVWIGHLKSMDCGDCKFEPVPESTAAGGTTQASFTSARECVSSCAGQGNCVGVSITGTTPITCSFFNKDFTPTPQKGSIIWRTSNCKDCPIDYEVLPNLNLNSDVNGQSNLLDQTFAVTLDQCKERCQSQKDCYAMVLMPATTWCASLLYLPGITGSIPDTGLAATSYRMIRKCHNCQYYTKPGYYTSAGATQMSQYTSQGGCLGGCDSDSTCVACAFKKAAGANPSICSFYKTSPVGLTNNPDFVVFEQRPGCLKCMFQYSKTSNTYIVTSSVQAGVGTESACKSVCDRDLACVSVDFRPSSSTCYINKNPMATLTTASSGINHYAKVFTCGDCTYHPYPAKRATNGRLQAAETSRPMCIQSCTLSKTCSMAAWDHVAKTCHFSSDNTYSSLVDASNSVSYIPTGCKVCSLKMAEKTNTVWLGSGYIPLPSTYSSPQACSNKCLGDSACVGVVYDKSSSGCRQFNTQGVDEPNQINYDLFQKVFDCVGFEYTPTFGKRTAISVTDVANVNDEAACANACKQNPGCQGFTWGSANKQCGSVAQYSAANLFADSTFNTWAFSRSRGCHERFQQETNQKFVPTSASDIISSTALTIQSCQQQCMARSGCQDYNYHSGSRSCEVLTSNRGSPSLSLGWIHDSKVYNCGNCTYIRYSGQAPGGFIKTSHKTAATCLDACTKDETCGSCDFDTRSNECMMFAGDPADKLASLTGVYHFSPIGCKQCQLVYSKKIANKLPAVSGPTQTYTPANNGGEAACKAQCRSDTQCTAFRMMRTSSQCLLYRYGFDPKNLVDDTTKVYDLYIKYRDCDGVLFRGWPGLRGNVAPSYVMPAYVTIGECLMACHKVAGAVCLGVDFNSQNNICTFLPTMAINRTPASSTVNWQFAGRRSEGCTSSWNMVPDKVVSNFNNAFSGTTVNEQSCKKACTADDKCTGFNIIPSTSTTNNNCRLVHNIIPQLATSVGARYYYSREICDDTSREQCTFEYLGARRSTVSSTQISVDSLTECLRACSNAATCRDVSYLTGSSPQCFMYDTSTSNFIASLVDSPQHRAYTLLSCGKPCDVKWVAYPGFHAPYGLRTYNMTTVGACRDACLMDETCKAVDTFPNVTQNTDLITGCWLHMNPNVINMRVKDPPIAFHLLGPRCPVAGAVTAAPTPGGGVNPFTDARQDTTRRRPTTYVPTVAMTTAGSAAVVRTTLAGVTNPPTAAVGCEPIVRDANKEKNSGPFEVKGLNPTVGYFTTTECITYCSNSLDCFAVVYNSHGQKFNCWLVQQSTFDVVLTQDETNVYILVQRCVNGQAVQIQTNANFPGIFAAAAGVTAPQG